MKKIKTIRQLQTEKKQLAQRSTELEKAIRYDWILLKKSLSPSQFFSKKEKKPDDKAETTIIGEALSGVATGLTDKLVEKAEEKIHKWFKK